MSAQVGRNKVIVATHRHLGNKIIPGAAMISHPMHQDDRRCVTISPFDKVQAQALRKKTV